MRTKTRRERECGKKNKFRSRKYALRFCEYLHTLDNNATGPRLEPYICGFCGFWHVGHRSKRLMMKYYNTTGRR